MFKRLMKFSAVAATAALALTACGSDSDDSGDAEYKIGISQFVNHPALNAAADGFKQAFEDADIDVEFDEQIAAADQGNVNDITSKFSQDSSIDLVTTIATASSITGASLIEDTPVVFQAVTDPVDAGLVDSLEEPGSNVTGVSDMLPVVDQLELLKEIVPDAKKVGLPYASSEANSRAQVKAAEEAAEDLDLELVEVTVTNSSEVPQALEKLSDVDAIYVITDNVIVSTLETVVSFGEENQIPLISGDPDSVERGAVATYGIDYFEHGKNAGEIAIQILQDGADPAEIPVGMPVTEDLKVVVNLEAAEAMGVELPDSVVDGAEIVTTEEDDESDDSDD